jgi:uncharacterized membrane protein
MRFLGWLGRFHILVIHFPIALLTAAALTEVAGLVRGHHFPSAFVRMAILLGAGSAIVAVPLGWLHAAAGGFAGATGGTLVLHRWLGSVTGLWSVGLLLASELDSCRGERSVLFRILLWTGAVLTIATAHYGGLLVHGDQFFDW